MRQRTQHLKHLPAIVDEKSGSFSRFQQLFFSWKSSLYQKTQDQLKQALYKLGELEGRLKEAENTIKAKEELIEELRNRIKELQAKPKRWWEFWK
ncbi:hypothetical protein JCM9492_00330 [Aquifex pyrophilus]